MDVYTDDSTLNMDAHLFPSTFGNAEYLHHDENNVDLLYTPHGIWSPEATFHHQQVYYGDVHGYGPLMVYDAMPCHLHVAPSYQIAPSHVAEQRLAGHAGQKRKSQNAATSAAQKRQKQSNSQRSSISSSGSPTSIASDSVNPAAPSSRAHYAVEKRYRTTLNDRYATLARLVSQPETQGICRTENKEWEVPAKLDNSNSTADGGPCKRQSKTTTLSVAIDTIALLDRCCQRKAKELQLLKSRLDNVARAVSTEDDCDKK